MTYSIPPKSWMRSMSCFSLLWMRHLSWDKRVHVIDWLNWLKVIQSCLTLCDPMDYTVYGILQARILEWAAFPFSRGSSQPRDWTQVSRIAGGFLTSWATKGRPRTLEWVAYPCSRGSSRTRNQTSVSCIAGGLFTNWAIKEAQCGDKPTPKQEWFLRIQRNLWANRNK